VELDGTEEKVEGPNFTLLLELSEHRKPTDDPRSNNVIMKRRRAVSGQGNEIKCTYLSPSCNIMKIKCHVYILYI
jgi:hypothetical protein